MHIVLVTSERVIHPHFLDPQAVSACHALAVLMAGRGHEVTLIWTSENPQPTEREQQAAVLRQQGIHVTILLPSDVPLEANSPAIQKSYRLLKQLEGMAPGPHTLVVPHDGGIGYFSTVAKREGVLPGCSKIAVLWAAGSGNGAEDWDANFESTELRFLEQSTLEMADGVLVTTPGWEETMRKTHLECRGPAFEAAGGGNTVWGDDAIRFLEAAIPAPSWSASPMPCRISVCMAHFNQARYLRDAVRSLESQTRQDFEFILVDDGSTDPDVAPLLRAFEESFARRGWKILRQPNAGPAAARNFAVQHATGDYLLFMDSDNIAMREEIEVFSSAARRTQADIYTTFMRWFGSEDPPASEQDTTFLWTPTGPSAALGFFRNSIGDTNSLFKRDVFLRLGGFPLDPNHGPIEEDRVFFIKALLSGCDVRLLPVAPFWYRRNDGRGRAASTSQGFESTFRMMLPLYEDAVPAALRPLLNHLARHYVSGINRPVVELATLQASQAEMQRARRDLALFHEQFEKLKVHFERLRHASEGLLGAADGITGSRRWRLVNTLRVLGGKLRIRSDGGLVYPRLQKAGERFQAKLARLGARLAKMERMMRSRAPVRTAPPSAPPPEPKPRSSLESGENLSERGATFFPPGHFHSPLLDLDQIHRDPHAWDEVEARCWDHVDLRIEAQRQFYAEILQGISDATFPLEPTPPRRYHAHNNWFNLSDALALSGIMRRFKPRRIIEIGSGFSSAVMLDTIDANRSLQDVALTFIEPNPERLNELLRQEDKEPRRIIRSNLQEVDPDIFNSLQANDILFIDSSHVAKIGSDVSCLFLSVLPKLQPGVIIHIHDIFYPETYLHEWTLRGWAWNESLFLRAFLLGNPSFEILAFNHFASRRLADCFQQTPCFVDVPGQSFWMRKNGK